MDLSPILRERHRQAMRSSRIKLVIMLVLLVVLALVAIELARWGRQAPEELRAAPEEGAEAEEQPKARVKPKEVGDFTPYERPDFATLPAGKPQPQIEIAKDEIEKKLPFLSDPKTLDQIIDRNADLEAGPLFYVLYQVFQDTQEKLQSEAQAVADWPLLWEQPAEYRNKPLRISGLLVRTWEQPLGENPMKLARLYAYRIRAENPPPASVGHLYDVYSMEKLKGALRYDRIVAYGRFLKAQLSQAERLEDPDLHTAVVIARRIETPTYLDEERLPGPIVDGNRPEARPLYWLLKRAGAIPFEELRAKANKNLTYLDFMNRPERYRGRPVAIYGQLRRLIRIKLPENLLGLEHVFYGQLADRDRHLNTFYCLDMPEGVRDGDIVTLYGYFLKKWTYTSEGNYEVHSPVIVAQRFLVVQDDEAGSNRSLQVGLAIIVSLTAAALGAAILAARAKDRRDAAIRRQREFERAQAKLHHKEADAPPPA